MSININKKYRPKKFSEVVGQMRSVQILTSAIEKNSIPPAYLFMGIRGAGKTTSARLLALALNCENVQGIEPCGVCNSCKEVLNDTSEYLLEIDGASSGGVADVRSLNQRVRFVVSNKHYKVVVIDECHMLSTAAWNAFLKTIEEPPARVLFVFCTTEFQKVPTTIKSRCVRVPFIGVMDSVISERIKYILTQEQVPFEEEAISLITKNAQGSIRDAQSILEGFINAGKVTGEQVKGVYQTLDPNTILVYLNHVINGEIEQASKTTKLWIRSGALPETIVSELLEHFKNMVMDFKIEDPSFRKMVKAQKEKIGNSIVDIISFFFDQLRYIKEYPMSYTLCTDLITIKLVDVITNRTKSSISHTTKKKAQKVEEKKETTETKVSNKAKPIIENNTDMPIATLEDNQGFENKAEILKNVCGGVHKVLPNKKCAIVKNAKGTIFDIVVSPEYAVSPMYVLASDLDAIISGYPTSMKTYIKKNDK